ncbi:MAG: DUF1697 domain-containing protein [Chitinophagales bacterium]|nr:DUF1697 domain-containing protein [Chitinophagales bacterium]
MQTYISILRGINVSGHRIIKMDALKKMCADLKFENIKTYIQSGNIVFQANEKTTQAISEILKTNIEKIFGFDVPVITLTQTELEKIVNSNPFLNDKSKDLAFFHITFLSEKPKTEYTELLKQINLKNDQFKIIDKALYLYCPDSYSNSKLTNSFIESKLKVTATTRNWKTVNQLLKMTMN